MCEDLSKRLMYCPVGWMTQRAVQMGHAGQICPVNREFGFSTRVRGVHLKTEQNSTTFTESITFSFLWLLFLRLQDRVASEVLKASVSCRWVLYCTYSGSPPPRTDWHIVLPLRSSQSLPEGGFAESRGQTTEHRQVAAHLEPDWLPLSSSINPWASSRSGSTPEKPSIGESDFPLDF